MSLQQFLELADCRIGLTQWSRQTARNLTEWPWTLRETTSTLACVLSEIFLQST